MAFFQFRQNNSGGAFEGDYIRYIIEADSAEAANNRAIRETEIYFNGVDNGSDCECCGDRWSPAWSGDKGDPEPMIYGKPIAKEISKWDWGLKTQVLYADGRRVDHGGE